MPARRDGQDPSGNEIVTDEEFASLLNDTSKTVEGDISWSDDEDHSPAVEFRAEVRSSPGYPLFVRGSVNPIARKLTYALIHRGEGCIYRLDLGQEHHNPSCEMVGDPHKHTWSEALKTKHAYKPPDISATMEDPEAVWRQFCAESRIAHEGRMHPLPPRQEDLL